MNSKITKMTLPTSRIFRILFGIIVISISAQLTIDVGSIPITGQTLAILVLAFLYSPLDIFIVTTLYLLLGFLGLPIFADGEHGFDKLTSGSGGFLIGFVLSSTIISCLYSSSISKEWLQVLLLTTLGTLIILICGVGRLTMLYGLEKGIAYGFTPFWIGAIIKIIVGTLVTVIILSVTKKNSKSE